MLRRLILLLILIGLAVLAFYLAAIPNVSQLRTHNPQHFALRDLREAQAKHKKRKLSSTQTWREIESISPHLRQAVLLAEDDRFYQHNGFDLEQIQRAIEIDWEKRRFAYGGSTITQQLARTLYLSPRKSLLRKAKEALITWQLERHLSKRRIFEIYLNVVEWGTGVYGAEAAAQHYFKKPASDLTPEEAVALAAILPSPRRWNPLSEKGFMNRRKTILYNRMVAAGHIPVAASSTSNELLNVERMVETMNDPADHTDLEEDLRVPEAVHVDADPNGSN